MGSANPDGCEDEGSMFSIIGIVGGVRLHRGRLSDGARQHESAAAAGGVDHYWRGGAGDGADFESGAHAEADDQRSDRSVWVVEIRHAAVCGIAEDDV